MTLVGCCLIHLLYLSPYLSFIFDVMQRNKVKIRDFFYLNDNYDDDFNTRSLKFEYYLRKKTPSHCLVYVFNLIVSEPINFEMIAFVKDQTSKGHASHMPFWYNENIYVSLFVHRSSHLSTSIITGIMTAHWFVYIDFNLHSTKRTWKSPTSTTCDAIRCAAICFWPVDYVSLRNCRLFFFVQKKKESNGIWASSTQICV